MTDALRDAELLADALLASWAGQQPEAIALAGYQARRDALSSQLFQVSDRIAGYDWEPSEIQQLLREVSSAMSDEVSLLQTLAPRPARPAATDSGTLALADMSGAGR
jgi:2-polyprenyl-6-methoxyphenol hydroxylase-like FAD-dependent oxidoreductase